MSVFRVDFARKGVYYVNEFISIENEDRMRFWFVALLVDEEVLELFCSKFQELGLNLRQMFENEYNEFHGIENSSKEDEDDIYPVATYDIEIRSTVPLEQVTHKSNNYFAPMYKSLDYNPLMLKNLPSYMIVLDDRPLFADFDYVDDAGKIVHHGRFGNNRDSYEVNCVQSKTFMEIDEATDTLENVPDLPIPSTSGTQMEFSDDSDDFEVDRPEHISVSKLKRKDMIVKRKRSKDQSPVSSLSDVEIDSHSSSEFCEKSCHVRNDQVEIIMRAQQMRKLKSKRVKRMYGNSEKARIIEIHNVEGDVRIEVFSKKLFNEYQGWLKFRFKEIDGLMYCSNLSISKEQFERALTFFRNQSKE